MDFSPTRAAALERMEKFVPRAASYSRTRNFDLGAEEHHGVSQLSPYIRTRLVTEEETTRAVLAEHSASATEKFLQEIAWRTYWKGWLEMRPAVWDHYRETLAEQSKSSAYENAIAGLTGIECFDHWVHELRRTGYIHNHARMWFASIWIFTLKLPWQLGAEHFLTHLIDADPASNTLSWRWVAGLHTKGKNYIARASNIKKFTDGRFDPTGQLNESAYPIAPDRDFEMQELRLPENPRPTGRVGHLIFPEDLASPPLESGKIVATAAFIPPALKTTQLVTQFLEGAIQDTIERTSGTLLTEDFSAALTDWISSENLDSVIVSQPTVGHTRDFLAANPLPKTVYPFVRSWDKQLWPHATAGFFKLKGQLPKMHKSLSKNSGQTQMDFF